MKRLTLTLVLIALSIFGSSVGCSNHKAKTCVAGPNEVCPSDQFLEDMNRVKDLDLDVKDKSTSPAVKSWREEIDLRNGMIDRLNPLITEQNKQGLKWSQDIGKFVRMTPDEYKQYMAQFQSQAPPIQTPQATPSSGDAAKK